MTDPETPPTHVPFAGMLIPLAVRDQLVAALRRRYPTVTTDLDDDATVRAVLLYWMASTLEADATEQANRGLAEASAALQSQYAARVAAARAAVQQAMAAIQMAPAEPSPPPAE